MAIIQPTDFTENALYDIALTMQVENEMPAFIDVIEKDILQELLGCELYDLFIADLTPTTPQEPQTQIYIDLFNAFCEQDDICARSYGIKDLLQGIIYFEWHRYNQNKSVSSGIVRMDSENSNLANMASANLYEKYNRAIKSYQAIQTYICSNIDVYPTYKGVNKDFASWI